MVHGFVNLNLTLPGLGHVPHTWVAGYDMELRRSKTAVNMQVGSLVALSSFFHSVILALAFEGVVGAFIGGGGRGFRICKKKCPML